jgi:UDP-4-amino-4-deoxy-L-arabinose-oxoglutarate aminotransferase
VKIRRDFLPFSRPSIGRAEIKAVVDCLRSGWITTGPKCKAFEDGFCRLTGASHSVSLSSATAGMHLTLLALGVGKGDEVITPSITFASTLNMITMTGARPVFADIDYDTLILDAAHAEALISARTKAIIPVHFAGAPADMERILALAKNCRLKVIEDAAHAVGTYYRGTHAGGFGHTAVFSFHPIKNITTGEGGMVVHNDDEFDRKIRLLRFHGIERDAWKRYGKGGNPEYDIQSPGFKYNLTDIQASIGLVQLARLEEMNRRREKLAALYSEGLSGIPGLELPGVPDYPHTHSWHLFVVKVLSLERERFMQKLSEYNIGYGLHFPAGHRLSYVKKMRGARRPRLKETERCAGRILSLPLYPDMGDKDVDYVCDAVKEILGNG